MRGANTVHAIIDQPKRCWNPYRDSDDLPKAPGRTHRIARVEIRYAFEEKTKRSGEETQYDQI